LPGHPLIHGSRTTFRDAERVGYARCPAAGHCRWQAIPGTGRRHMEEEIKRGVLTVIHNGLLW
jgi:hypothetical protein